MLKNKIELPFIKELDRNLKSDFDFIQIIIGPRQVGKTTSTIHYFESHFKNQFAYYSVDSIFYDHQWLKNIWIDARQSQKTIIIDEIQKISNWSEQIKSLWDENKRLKIKIKCILLGSSSFELHKGLTESLTGRFQLIKAFHWNYEESHRGYGITFEEFLKFGGYPASYLFKDHPKDWKKYIQESIVETVIEKDIIISQKIKSPSLFRQTFEILLAYPAQEISYTKLLGQLQDKGNVELIKNYIKLYEAAFLIKTLHKFSTNKIKLKTSSPKIIPMCPAFPFLFEMVDYSLEARGHIFELLVAHVLIRTGHEIYYWREKNFEVDFVLKYGKRILAIEVKSGRKRKMAGMTQFQKLFKTAEQFVITFDNYFELEKDANKFFRII